MSDVADDPKRPFDIIVGEKLSAVTFVLDYWQLQFDGPTINVYTRIDVQTGEAIARDGDDQFRNRLCEQIGKTVKETELTASAFTINLADGSTISISLRDEDYRGPEAMYLHSDHQKVFAVI